MKKTLILIFALFIFSCAKTTENERALIMLYKEYAKSIQNYNKAVLKLRTKSVLTKKIQNLIKKHYIKKYNVKKKMDLLTKKLSGKVSSRVFNKLKKLRIKIRKLLKSNIEIRQSVINIKGTGRFFEDLLLNHSS